MKKEQSIILRGWCRLILGVALGISLAYGPAMGAEGIDPEADRILQSMSTYLGGTKAFSINADIDLEIVSQNGQKIQLCSLAMIVMERPAKFHITRKGMVANTEFIFDGKTLTLHGKNLNIYAQTEITGTIDDAIRAYEMETGIPAPGADLFFADPYAILSTGIKSSVYIGTAYVNGVECHHLAFREANVDWQLWIKTGDEPLPMKYVITSKWHTGAPQYEIRLRDWNTNPAIKTDQYAFTVPEGAKKLETIPTDKMGEFTWKQEGQ
jgi:hypothetical protein